jgi:hypothetical protein
VSLLDLVDIQLSCAVEIVIKLVSLYILRNQGELRHRLLLHRSQSRVQDLVYGYHLGEAARREK